MQGCGRQTMATYAILNWTKASFCERDAANGSDEIGRSFGFKSRCLLERIRYALVDLGPLRYSMLNCIVKIITVLLAIGFILVLVRPADAQTFNDAFFNRLNNITSGSLCEGGSGLRKISENFCSNSPAEESAAPATVPLHGGAEQAIERRLPKQYAGVQGAPSGRRRNAPPSMRPTKMMVLADYNQLQLPQAGGDDIEIVVGPARGLSLFVGWGRLCLDHNSNSYKAFGYDAVLPAVTAGLKLLVHASIFGRSGFQLYKF